MKKLKDLLFILQLEQYDYQRFYLWLKTNQTSEIKEEKKRFIWTIKARLIFFIALPFHVLMLTLSPEKALRIAFNVVSPFEVILRRIVISLATQKILQRRDLTVVGVTGSYAKTSTKEILAHLLSCKYKVLKTPESYNTQLGVSRVVLEQLNSSHQFFVVEMAMYSLGEIKLLCDIVRPKVGIVTAIGLSHLERLGSIEKIFQAKYELIDSLPKGGLAILNGDDDYCKKMAFKRKDLSFVYCNLSKQPDSSYWATDIKQDSNGSKFILHTSGGEVNVITPLLGIHNVLNILFSAAVCSGYKMSLEEIARGCSSLSPIPHRLEIIPSNNNSIVIDDSYNANPASVKAALEVLDTFQSDNKIVVTPGMIELGKKQFEENEKFGNLLARSSNYVIVVGNTNKEAIIKGISKAKTKVHSLEVKSLIEATERLKEIVRPGSVILFENDLPDQYN